MLIFPVAPTEATSFLFDSAALAKAALIQWPNANIITPPADLADLADLFIELPHHEDPGFSELTIQTRGRAVVLDAPDHETAARILAWLAATAPLPADGSVVVIHWTDDFYPLLPGVTYEQLMQDATTYNT